MFLYFYACLDKLVSRLYFFIFMRIQRNYYKALVSLVLSVSEEICTPLLFSLVLCVSGELL